MTIKCKIIAHRELQKSDYFFVNLSLEYIGLMKPEAFSEDIWQLLLLDLIPQNKYSFIQFKKIQMKKKVYLHLETYEHFKRGNLNLEINGFKENTFALGLIILEIALNINIQHLFDDNYQLLKGIYR